MVKKGPLPSGFRLNGESDEWRQWNERTVDRRHTGTTSGDIHVNIDEDESNDRGVARTCSTVTRGFPYLSLIFQRQIKNETFRFARI